MPTPSVLPTMTARPKPSPSTRRRPAGCVGLRVEGNEDHFDRVADIGAEWLDRELEFHIAGLPPIHDGLAVRRVLDIAARQMDDDRVGRRECGSLRARRRPSARATPRRVRLDSGTKLMPVNGASPGFEPPEGAAAAAAAGRSGLARPMHDRAVPGALFGHDGRVLHP